MINKRIKIFYEDVQSRGSSSESVVELLEKKINEWLEKTNIVEIISIMQSENKEGTTISILYTPESDRVRALKP